MKEIKLDIGCYVRAKYLDLPSFENENYYEIDSVGDSCIIYHPYNIIQEIALDNYYEYNLGHFEKEGYKDFVGVFSWTSEYGADSLFEGVE